MNIWKRAAELRIVFTETGRGTVTLSDLYSLSVDQLDAAAVAVDTELNKPGANKSFRRNAKTDGNEVLALKLELLKEVIADKEAAALNAVKAVEEKQRKALIASIIEKKQLVDLENKSIEELTKMLGE